MSERPITQQPAESHHERAQEASQESQEPMTRARLLELMRADRARWEAAIGALEASGAGRLEQTGFAGVWSARDVIAHITAYERWMLDALEAWARGEEPAPSVLDGDDMDARNMTEHERTRDRSLAAVQAEARRVWERLVALVATVPEEVLVDVERAPGFVHRHWGRDTALWEAIWGLGGEHYDEHLPDFAAATARASGSASKSGASEV